MCWQCETSSLVYKATMVRGDDEREETYTGLTFKKWRDLPNFEFRLEKQEGAAKLYGYIWQLKRSNVLFLICWEKLKMQGSSTLLTKKCNLRLQEKFRIMFHRDRNSRKKALQYMLLQDSETPSKVLLILVLPNGIYLYTELSNDIYWLHLRIKNTVCAN